MMNLLHFVTQIKNTPKQADFRSFKGAIAARFHLDVSLSGSPKPYPGNAGKRQCSSHAAQEWSSPEFHRNGVSAVPRSLCLLLFRLLVPSTPFFDYITRPLGLSSPRWYFHAGGPCLKKASLFLEDSRPTPALSRHAAKTPNAAPAPLCP